MVCSLGVRSSIDLGEILFVRHKRFNINHKIAAKGPTAGWCVGGECSGIIGLADRYAGPESCKACGTLIMRRSDGTLAREFGSCISLVPFSAQLSRERRVKNADWRELKDYLRQHRSQHVKLYITSRWGLSSAPNRPGGHFLLSAPSVSCNAVSTASRKSHCLEVENQTTRIARRATTLSTATSPRLVT